MVDGLTTEMPERSSFVTVLAWVFIIVSGCMTLMGVLQNVSLMFLPPIEAAAAFTTHSAGVQFPSAVGFMIAHFRTVAVVLLVLPATMLIASIGLLKRQSWARHLFIALLVLGIVWNVLGLVVQQLFLSGVLGPNATADFRMQFQIVRVVTFVFSLFWAVAFSAVFWWIIRRLRSAPIMAEFSEARRVLV